MTPLERAADAYRKAVLHKERNKVRWARIGVVKEEFDANPPGQTWTKWRDAQFPGMRAQEDLKFHRHPEKWRWPEGPKKEDKFFHQTPEFMERALAMVMKVANDYTMDMKPTKRSAFYAALVSRIEGLSGKRQADPVRGYAELHQHGGGLQSQPLHLRANSREPNPVQQSAGIGGGYKPYLRRR